MQDLPSRLTHAAALRLQLEIRNSILVLWMRSLREQEKSAMDLRIRSQRLLKSGLFRASAAGSLARAEQTWRSAPEAHIPGSWRGERKLDRPTTRRSCRTQRTPAAGQCLRRPTG